MFRPGPGLINVLKKTKKEDFVFLNSLFSIRENYLDIESKIGKFI